MKIPRTIRKLKSPGRVLKRAAIKSRRFLREGNLKHHLLPLRLILELDRNFSVQKARLTRGWKGIETWQRQPLLRLANPKQKTYFTISTDVTVGRVQLAYSTKRGEKQISKIIYFPFKRMDEESFLTSFRVATKEAIKMHKEGTKKN